MSGITNVNKTKTGVGGVNLNNPAEIFNTVIVLCAVIFISALLFYSLLRFKLKWIYAPRLLLLDTNIVIPGSTTQSFFSWVIPALKTTDHDVFSFAGLDALVFLRFLKLVLKLAVITLPFGMVVLLPLNIYGGNNLTDGLDKLSMSNVASGCSKLWAHWLAVWLYSLVVFFLTFQEWKVYIKFRQLYLRKGIGHQYAVLVQNIPANIKRNEDLQLFVDAIFPGKIHSVYMVKDLSGWEKLIQNHDKYVLKWEKAQAYLEQKNERMKLKKNPCDSGRDAITDYEEKLKEIQEILLKEQHSTNQQQIGCAFVFFKALMSRTQALNSVWEANPLEFDISPAPDANEILWSNLSMHFVTRNLRMIVGFVFVFFLVIFWTTPILFVSSLTKLQSLAAELKWLDTLKTGTSKLLLSMVQGVVPVALISLFYIILPYILRAVGRFQGRVCKSNISMITFKFLFIFQTFNTFFIYIISGSVFAKLSEIIKAPHKIPNILAKSLPSQAGFFLNYITLQSFVGLALELTRIVPLLLTTFKTKFFARTKRGKLEAWKPSRPEYEIMYSQALLFFLIGISYSVLSPIIIPFFVLYYAFGYVVWMNQLLHVYIPEFDHGGKFWPPVFSRIIVAVVVFQLLMVGVFLLKQQWYAAVLLAPLVILTAGFWLVMSEKYRRNSEHMVLSEAIDMKPAEQSFLDGVEKDYIRNFTVPGLFEMSSDIYSRPDEYMPLRGNRVDTDEESLELGENQPFLPR